MLSALKSNFYVMKSTFYAVAILHISFLFLAHFTKSNNIYILCTLFTVDMVTASMCEPLIPDSFTSLLVCSPVSRKNMVLGKYLSIFFFYTLTLLVCSAIMFILGDVTLLQAFNFFIVYNSISIINMSVSFPMTYIFKPKYVSFAICFIIFLTYTLSLIILAVFLNYPFATDKQALFLFDNFLDNPTAIIVTFIISIVFLCISISISVKAFMKKEF